MLLQIYAGGQNNTPESWNGYFEDLEVEAGLWSRHGNNCAEGDSPDTVKSRMTNWKNDIRGGWMWLLDDMLECDTQYPLEDYAVAINTALD